MDPFNDGTNGKTEAPTQSPFMSGTPSPRARISRPDGDNTGKNLILVTENAQYPEK